MKIFKKIKKMPWLALFILKCLSRLLVFTLRKKVVDPEGYLNIEYNEPTIFVTWHNRTLLFPFMVPKSHLKKCVFLASLSRDGGYISDYFSYLGMIPVRGSSSRGGARALKRMREKLEEGKLICLTPDGPRGPKYVIHDGVIWLGSVTQCPIVPVAINTKSHKELDNWDNTQIPFPFSETELVFGEAFKIPENVPKEDLEKYQKKIYDGIMDLVRWDHDS